MTTGVVALGGGMAYLDPYHSYHSCRRCHDCCGWTHPNSTLVSVLPSPLPATERSSEALSCQRSYAMLSWRLATVIESLTLPACDLRAMLRKAEEQAKVKQEQADKKTVIKDSKDKLGRQKKAAAAQVRAEKAKEGNSPVRGHSSREP